MLDTICILYICRIVQHRGVNLTLPSPNYINILQVMQRFGCNHLPLSLPLPLPPYISPHGDRKRSEWLAYFCQTRVYDDGLECTQGRFFGSALLHLHP